jgi:hypothetical protein
MRVTQGGQLSRLKVLIIFHAVYIFQAIANRVFGHFDTPRHFLNVDFEQRFFPLLKGPESACMSFISTP